MTTTRLFRANAEGRRLMMQPLKYSGAQIAEQMKASGTGKFCGVCGKPFNKQQPWQSIARRTFADANGKMMMIAWLLCGKCQDDVQRNGGKLPDVLQREAEEVLEAAMLAMIDPAGTA